MTTRLALATALALTLTGCAIGSGETAGFIGPPAQYVSDPAADPGIRPDQYPTEVVVIKVVPDVPM